MKRTLDNADARFEELRTCVEDPENKRFLENCFAARKIVHSTHKLASTSPGIFIGENETEVELRWIFGHLVLSVTFADDINVYIFDRQTESITEDITEPYGTNVLPHLIPILTDMRYVKNEV